MVVGQVFAMAHLNYYVDLCVDVFVVNKAAVLLRLHEKYNCWITPGGHIDPGEDANEAALREVWEESGLRVTLVGPPHWQQIDTETNRDLVPPLFVNRHSISDTHEHSAFIFAAQSNSRDIDPQEEASKHAEYRWCTLADLDELLQSDNRLHPEVHRYASWALTVVTDET